MHVRMADTQPTIMNAASVFHPVRRAILRQSASLASLVSTSMMMLTGAMRPAPTTRSWSALSARDAKSLA